MKEDMPHWRCACGNESPQASLLCFKCGKQRWSHLGVLKEAAEELLAFIYTPASARMNGRKR